MENGLHRTPDVQFREDDGRLRHGPTVVSIPGRAALPRFPLTHCQAKESCFVTLWGIDAIIHNVMGPNRYGTASGHVALFRY